MVHLAAFVFILGIERASVLIDHDPRIFERLIAAAVEFFGKKAFRRAERIGRIVDDEVVFPLFSRMNFSPSCR